jgi:hypothetical protein
VLAFVVSSPLRAGQALPRRLLAPVRLRGACSRARRSGPSRCRSTAAVDIANTGSGLRGHPDCHSLCIRIRNSPKIDDATALRQTAKSRCEPGQFSHPATWGLVPRHSDYDWLILSQSRMANLPEEPGFGCFWRHRVEPICSATFKSARPRSTR